MSDRPKEGMKTIPMSYNAASWNCYLAKSHTDCGLLRIVFATVNAAILQRNNVVGSELLF